MIRLKLNNGVEVEKSTIKVYKLSSTVELRIGDNQLIVSDSNSDVDYEYTSVESLNKYLKESFGFVLSDLRDAIAIKE